MYELKIKYTDGTEETYLYRNQNFAEDGAYRFRQAFGNQIEFTCVTPLVRWTQGQWDNASDA